jgi:hypothetical protein
MLCGSLGTKSGSPCKMKLPCMWHVHHHQPELCSICMEDVGSHVYETSCRHQFHHDCLFKWMEKSDFCPVCRSTSDPLVKFKKTVSSSSSSASGSNLPPRSRRNRRRRRNRRNRRRMAARELLLLW